jgi:TonB family protein
VERGVANGRRTLAICAADSAGKRGTVLEMSEAEVRDVLTTIWALSSERDSALLAHETIGGDTVWSERGVAKPARPRPTKRFAPYPRRLLERGVEGGAVLSFVVDTGGAPMMQTLEVLDETHPEFTKSAIDFLRRASFEPAEVSGRKVRARCILPFSFAIVLGGGPPRPPSAFDVLRIADRDPQRRPSP